MKLLSGVCWGLSFHCNLYEKQAKVSLCVYGTNKQDSRNLYLYARDQDLVIKLGTVRGLSTEFKRLRCISSVYGAG